MFTDPSFGRPMPIRDPIGRLESGNGYALRMVALNGLSFSDLTKVLASIGHGYLPNRSAQMIAFWFGAEPIAASRAIPYTYKLNGRLVTSYMGCQFMRPYHVRFSRPQVCVHCLDEYGIAMAVWDISLVTCCPKHGVILIDRCAKCKRVLSWRRPDLYTCHCRADLCSMIPDQATPDAIWLSHHIGCLLFGESDLPVSESRSRQLLGAFSLDVLLRVVRALGVSEGDHVRDIVPGKLTRILSTDEAHGVVYRAFSRVKAILIGIGAERYADCLHLAELRVIGEHVTGIERTMFEHLLDSVADIDAQCASVKPVKSQLRLF